MKKSWFNTRRLVLLFSATLLLVVFVIAPFVNTIGTTNQNSNQPHAVPLDQIVAGGPPPDGIPSIDSPKFLPASQATFLSDQDSIIGLQYNGSAKAYPLLIMVWHEIVNDFAGPIPVVITYCPLCYSSEAFVRELNGKVVTFGTSGKLYNNNLVMYDRSTKSLWSEIWGQAIAGNLTGRNLQQVPIDVMPWSGWKRLYPNTLVLSEDTGYSRPYGSDPYAGYYTEPSLYFPISHVDTRLALKTVVVGIIRDGVSTAYRASLFNQSKVIAATLGAQQIVLLSLGSETARAFSPVVNGNHLTFTSVNGTFVDDQTKTFWSYDGAAISGPLRGTRLTRVAVITAFWFAWVAFYPETSSH